jgi:hypothetical protein
MLGYQVGGDSDKVAIHPHLKPKFLTGNPDLILTFSNPKLMENCAFHPCIRYGLSSSPTGEYPNAALTITVELNADTKSGIEITSYPSSHQMVISSY